MDSIVYFYIHNNKYIPKWAKRFTVFTLNWLKVG